MQQRPGGIEARSATTDAVGLEEAREGGWRPVSPPARAGSALAGSRQERAASRHALHGLAAALFALAAACTPSPHAACDTTQQCADGESCYQGLCIRRELLPGYDAGTTSDAGSGGPGDAGGSDAGASDAGSDAGASDAGSDAGASDAGSDAGATDAGSDAGAGDAGATDAGSDAGSDAGATDAGSDAGPPDAGGCVGAGCGASMSIVAPATAALVGKSVHVVASLSLGVAPDFVRLSVVQSSAELGHLDVALANAGPGGYAGDVSFTAVDGAAQVRATAFSGGAPVVSAAAAITVDQTGPALSTSWAGGGWIARNGALSVPAAVTDTGSGVASAQLLATLGDGGTATVPGAVDGGSALFAVPGSLGWPGRAEQLGFSLAAADQLANTSALPHAAALALKIDDEPPAVGAAPPATWTRRGTVSLPVTVDDGAGSGVAGFQLHVGSAVITGVQGSPFSVDTSLYTGAGFEGALAFQVTAQDAVGNPASAQGVLLVDDAPPSLGVLGVLDPDYTDGSGTQWINPGSAGSFTAEVALDPGQGSPIALASLALQGADGFEPTCPPGALQNATPPYRFLVPRCYGTGREGPVGIGILADDQAGNHVSGPGQATPVVRQLSFDGRPPHAATLSSPTGWVARSGTGGVRTQSLGVKLLDDGSGVSSAAIVGGGVLISANKLDWTGSASLAGAQAGVAGPFQVGITAVDNVNNGATLSVSLQVDDAAPVIAADPANPIYGAASWHSVRNGTLSITPTVVISDSGSGVSGLAGHAPALRIGSLSGSAPDATATLQGGGTPASGTWSFGPVTLPGDASIENDAYPLYVDAQDLVGNPAARATLTVHLDNRPPALVAAPAFAQGESPDATDAGGAAWFKGASWFSGTAPAVNLSASFSDPFFAAASAAASNGSTVNASCTLVSGTRRDCNFQVPRPAASGDVVITFDAADSAGNTLLTKPTFTLHFDDVVPAGFTPAVAPDATWYARGSPDLPVSVTLPGLPASGLVSLALHVPGRTDLLPGAPTGLTWTFQLPTTWAAASAEGPIAFDVIATDLFGATATGSGSRSVDDLPPVLDAAIATYPAPASGPMSWSHDGAHFNLREGPVRLFTIKAHDCGADLGPNPPTVTMAGLSATVNNRVDTGAVASCSNGRSPPIWRWDVVLDLASAPGTTWPQADNTPSFTIGLSDAAAGGSHSASATRQPVTVTRRLWSSGGSPAALDTLALGPAVFAASSASGIMVRFDPNTGALSGTLATDYKTGLVTTDGGGSPSLFYVTNTSPNAWVALDATSATRIVRRECAPGTSSTWEGVALYDATRPLVSVDVFGGTVSRVMNLASCTPDATLPYFQPGNVALSASTLYSTDPTIGSFEGLYAIPLATGTPGPELTGGLLQVAIGGVALGSGGAEVVFAGGGAATFAYLGSTQQWQDSYGQQVPLAYGSGAAATVVLGGIGGLFAQPLLGGSASQLSANSSTPWGVAGDSSGCTSSPCPSTPSLLLADQGGTLTALSPTTGSPVWSVGGFSAITALALRRDNKVAYFTSNGTLFAVATESPGFGTSAGGPNATAWPAPARDACNSRNLAYNCPY